MNYCCFSRTKETQLDYFSYHGFKSNSQLRISSHLLNKFLMENYIAFPVRLTPIHTRYLTTHAKIPYIHATLTIIWAVC